MNDIKLIFSGDLAPFNLKNANDVIFSDNLLELFKNSEVHITNLECPLTDGISKINKSGPHIKSNPHNINILKSAFVNVACLANNHIFDYDEEGLLDTINVCKVSGIDTIGIVNRTDNKPSYLIKEIKDKKIGFLNYCEHEFSVRENGRIGANGYDSVKIFYEINELKKLCDYVLVIYHGGNEYYPLPRPGLKKIFRYLIDIGSDAVISHHTHTISGYEIYKEKPIIYGLGNFYFSYENEPEEWFTGLLCELIIGNGISFDLHPVKQSDDFKNICVLEGDEKNFVLNKIKKLNEIINDKVKLEKEWNKYIDNIYEGYLKSILNFSKFEKLLLKSGFFRKRILKKRNKTGLSNLIKCESHREILIKSLQNYG